MEESQKRSAPWNIVVALIFVIGLYFAAQILASIALLWHPHAADWLTKSVIGQFWYVVLAESLTVGGLLLFLRGFRYPLRELGLRRPRWRDPVLAVAVYVLYVAVFAGVVIVAKRFIPALNVDQKQEIGFDNVQGTLALVLTFISLVILPPITEELLVRGFLFTSFRKYLKFGGAAVLTSLVFAAAHLPEGGAAGPLYIAAIDTFILSLFLCWLREQTGSLWAGIGLHALKNGVAFAALFIFASR